MRTKDCKTQRQGIVRRMAQLCHDSHVMCHKRRKFFLKQSTHAHAINMKSVSHSDDIISALFKIYPALQQSLACEVKGV